MGSGLLRLQVSSLTILTVCFANKCTLRIVLGIVRFAEPLALTSVFPYLPEMIKSFGIPQDNVAKWAGLVGSTFSISQSLFAVPWGRLSDKIGRKPTILIGLVNVMFCFLLWGTSKSLAQALTARFLMGLGNGNGASWSRPDGFPSSVYPRLLTDYLLVHFCKNKQSASFAP